jgi:hypothetical protein
MNRTRIEIAAIPPELPAPHFDEEATIVSARQVVPIAHAKVVERSRTLLSVIPILIGAAVFGALGALGVNYYENRQRSNASVSAPKSEISQPINQPPASQTQGEIPMNSRPESPAGALAASESPSPGSGGSQTQDQTDSLTNNANRGLDRATVDSNAPDNKAVTTKPAAQTNLGNSAEPGKLVRKRRVHPLAQTNGGKTENPPKDKRGAGRIQEIFAGPNPQ